MVVVTRDQIIEVQASSESAALDLVESHLKQQDPRDVFRLQVAKEVNLEEDKNE